MALIYSALINYLSKLIGGGKCFHSFAARPLVLPSWLSEEDIQYYATKFNKTGFSGGMNYYRNLDCKLSSTLFPVCNSAI